jgi:aryl-alcohol dehydrogenase-like predicted oxidoreductase
MDKRKLGRTGPAVSALGLGCMGMSGMYGPADRAESIATLHAALDAGIDLVDTGDFYGMGHNEMLIGEVLAQRPRGDWLVSVKFGALRDPDQRWNGYDARPIAVKNFVAYSLQRLRVDCIDLYRPARLDPNVPIEDTIGAIADLVKAGHVRHIGLSEVGAQTIRRAAAVHPIADLQIEYSLVSRGIEDNGTSPPAANWASASRPMACSRAASSAVTGIRRDRHPATSATRARASSRATSKRTCGSSRRCGALPGCAAPAWRKSRSRGCSRRARTSCR